MGPVQRFGTRNLITIVLLLGLLAVVVACGDDETPTSRPQPTAAQVPATATPVPAGQPMPTATPVPAAQPMPTATPVSVADQSRYGGVVAMNNQVNPTLFDPHLAGLYELLAASSPVYNQVLEFNPVNPSEVIGDLAKSWEASSDGKAYTFQLHEGVKWHDGVDLTADDLVFSVERMIKPGEQRPRAGRLRQYIDRVEKVDRHTFTIHLEFPSLGFVQFMAPDYMKVMPKHLEEQGVDVNVFNNMVGSGPFIPVDFSEGVSFEFEKNPNYFKEGLPYFDGIKAFVIADKGTEIAAYQTERIMMPTHSGSTLGPEDVLRLEEDSAWSSKMDVWWLEQADGAYLTVNVKKEPFDDPRVRRALFLALDRHLIVEGLGQGFWSVGAPLKHIDPYGFPLDELLTLPGYRQLDEKKHPDDIAEAKALLKEAGAEGFETEFLAFSGIGLYVEMAQAAVDQLSRALDIQLDMTIADTPTVFGRAFAGDFTFMMSGIGPMIVDPDDRFQSIYTGEGTFNLAQWSDSEVDALFEQQQREIDPARRRELSVQMQRLALTGSPPVFELAWQAWPVPVNKRIKTEAGHYVVSNSIQNRLKHEHEWLEP